MRVVSKYTQPSAMFEITKFRFTSAAIIDFYWMYNYLKCLMSIYELRFRDRQ